jgi:hypothetical protein
MLVPDYLAIGTLVILSLGAMARVCSKKGGVSLTDRVLPRAVRSRSFDNSKDTDRPCSFNQRAGAAR